MSIEKLAINSLANVLYSDKFWVDTKALCAAINNTNPELTGSQKRVVVFEDLKKLGIDVIDPLINLAIELAVVYLGTKAPFAAPLIQAAGDGLKSTIAETTK